MIHIESTLVRLFLKQVRVNLFSTFSVNLPEFSRCFYFYGFSLSRLTIFQHSTLNVCSLLYNRPLELLQLAELKLYTLEE